MASITTRIAELLNVIFGKREIIRRATYLVNSSEVIDAIKDAQPCLACAAHKIHLAELKQLLYESQKREEQTRQDFKELQDLILTRFGVKPWAPSPSQTSEPSEITRERRGFQTGLERMAKKQSEKSKEAWQEQIEKVAKFDEKQGIQTDEKEVSK